jgi:DNA-binding PadR family transcriptional regulator
LLAIRTEVSEEGLQKKLYSLTEEGKKALTAYSDGWKALQQSLAKITKKK